MYIESFIEPEGGKEKITLRHQPDIFEIVWLKVGDRIRVILKHHPAKWVFLPIKDLILDIIKDWQIVNGDFGNFLEIQSKKYNIDIPELPLLREHKTESALAKSDSKEQGWNKMTEKTKENYRNGVGGKEKIFVPKRRADLQNRKFFWQKIKPFAHLKMNDILQRVQDNPQFNSVRKYKRHTIRNIIKAGQAGELE